jgi:hypothetical protein
MTRMVIRSSPREEVCRIPNSRFPGGNYIVFRDELLALGSDSYASANCLCGLSELALSSNSTIRWFPPDFYQSLATDNIRRTGYFPERAQVFVPLIQSIFSPDVRLAIFYVFLASHFVTVAIDKVSQQILGYDSLHGYTGTPLDLIISDIVHFILDSTTPYLRPQDFVQWPIITDAAQRVGMPRQITGDCCRYAFLIASCLAAPTPFPLCLLTPQVLDHSRTTLMSWLFHRMVPPITNF